MWECNFHSKDVPLICKAIGFWKDVIISWAQYNYHKPKEEQDILSQVIWINSYLRIKGKPFFWLEVYDQGLIYFRDMIVAENLATYALMLEKFEHFPILKYDTLISCIPVEWNQVLRHNNESDIYYVQTSRYQELMDEDRIANYVYSRLISSTKLAEDRLVLLNKNLHKGINTDEYLSCIKSIYVSTKISK